MTLRALDVPDDPAQLPAWLEGHVQALDLGQLVAELTALLGPEEPSRADLDQVLGAQKQAVLNGGLAVLAPETMRRLLVRPRLLLELQELVLSEGGPYWQTLTPDAEHGARIQHGAERLETFLAAQAAAARWQLGTSPRWYRRPWFVSLATAASVLAALPAYEHLFHPPAAPQERSLPEAAPETWGWNRPGAVPAGTSRTEYLDRLSVEAGEWFERRPTAAADLARRIHEFRAGCTHLIFAEHRPLPAADRETLVENCRIWGRRFDKQIAALEAGQHALDVRNETDGLVREVIERLHEHARKP